MNIKYPLRRIYWLRGCANKNIDVNCEQERKCRFVNLETASASKLSMQNFMGNQMEVDCFLFAKHLLPSGGSKVFRLLFSLVPFERNHSWNETLMKYLLGTERNLCDKRCS